MVPVYNNSISRAIILQTPTWESEQAASSLATWGVGLVFGAQHISILMSYKDLAWAGTERKQWALQGWALHFNQFLSSLSRVVLAKGWGALYVVTTYGWRGRFLVWISSDNRTVWTWRMHTSTSPNNSRDRQPTVKRTELADHWSSNLSSKAAGSCKARA